MKKLLFAFIIFLSFASCRPEVTSPKNEYYNDSSAIEIFNGVDYRIVVIDSCEYILGRDHESYNGGFFLTHKGNCKNPIHYKNIEKITVVDTVEYQLIKTNPAKHYE